VGVDEHDGVALFAEGLARLGAGIVELARLTDDDGTGADEEDLVDVGTLGHAGVVPQRTIMPCRLAATRSRSAGRAPRSAIASRLNDTAERAIFNHWRTRPCVKGR